MKKLIAYLLGYFWIPCPICNEYFAGFEISKYSLKIDENNSKCICKKCTYTAIALNAIKFKEVPIRDIFIVFKNNIDFSDIKLIEEK